MKILFSITVFKFYFMNSKLIAELEYTDKLLEIIEHRDNFTTSDLQGTVQAIVHFLLTDDKDDKHDPRTCENSKPCQECEYPELQKLFAKVSQRKTNKFCRQTGYDGRNDLPLDFAKLFAKVSTPKQKPSPYPPNFDQRELDQ